MTAAALLLAAATLMAQVPVGKAPKGPVLLKGGVIHTGTGEVLKGGLLGMTDGKISLVAPAGTQVDESPYEVINLEGAHVYPGFIAPDVDLGLVEVSAVRATRDNRETGEMNPNVRALTSYNTDSEIIPTFRFNGILLAQVTPRGSLVRGMSSIMALDGWNWEDAAYQADEGIHVGWPSSMTNSFDWSTRTREFKENKNYKKNKAKLNALFDDALAYSRDKSKERKTNLRLEAMLGLFDGSSALYVHANSGPTMVDAVLTAKAKGVKRVVIIGGRDAIDVADFLVEHKVPVILGGIHRLPRSASSDVNRQYKMPAMLKKAGVKFCFSYNSNMSARNLPFLAGSAVAWGLDRNDALAALTLETAKILGIDKRTGSLEKGKDANLFVSAGDALDMRTNQVSHIFIRGREVATEAMQQRYYERYKAKYGH